MNFASDNNAGVCPEVLAAVAAESAVVDAAYGMDQASARLEATIAEVFEAPAAVYPVATGTASNSLALAALTPPWGSVLCHASAHILVDECAAPTVLGGGITLEGVSAPHGKLTTEAVSEHVDQRRDSGVHTVALSTLSLTQATEAGTRYSPSEIGALSDLARSHGLRVHMDGARFANAVAAGGSSPAELTWKAGVDVLSLGATKGGALAAEAVIVFADDLRAEGERFERLRKRSGHLLSKQRLVSAQLLGWLETGVWLRHADHADVMATRLAVGLHERGVELLHPVEANMVFALLDAEQHRAATAAGAVYYTERPLGAAPDDDRVECRLVTSWSTTMEGVDGLLNAVGSV